MNATLLEALALEHPCSNPSLTLYKKSKKTMSNQQTSMQLLWLDLCAF